MGKPKKVMVNVGELACSNLLTMSALVELLEEKGILTQKEVIARYKKLVELSNQKTRKIQ